MRRSVWAIVLILQQGNFVYITAQLYSEMLVASLILAVAVTTALVRADNTFNISTGCVVRRGQCDTTELTTREKAMPKETNSKTLQQCAADCKVQITKHNLTIYYVVVCMN